MDLDYKRYDFNSWYQVLLEKPSDSSGSGDSEMPDPAETPKDDPDFDPSNPKDMTRLAERLRKLTTVEFSYVMRPVAPPAVSISPISPPLIKSSDDPLAAPNAQGYAQQGYLDTAARHGMDIRYAWNFKGGHGKDIGFVDMEQGWNPNHEDLKSANLSSSCISGINRWYYNHGTKTLGCVMMLDNQRGGVGIAPACRGRMISVQRPNPSDPAKTIYNVPDTIVDAAKNMAYGDVLLLEIQSVDKGPVESLGIAYQSIRLATALGMVVVEAGGNNGGNMNDIRDGGKAVLDRTSVDFRDSGAIMVGACLSDTLARKPTSAHGNRVDVFAWGDKVATTRTSGDGDKGPPDAYATKTEEPFSETSAASAIIAGAALVVQGIAQANLGYRLSPKDVRAALTVGGTPSLNPGADQIGVLPNFRNIITNAFTPLTSDAFIRSSPTDAGVFNTTTTSANLTSSSPDIIIRQSPLSTPQTTLGPSSNTSTSMTLCQPLVQGRNHTIYARALNRGGIAVAANSLTVTFYHCPTSTLLLPSLWTRIGSTTFPTSITPNRTLSVSNALTWPASSIPDTDNGSKTFALIALLGSSAFPAPTPASLTVWSVWLDLLYTSNNFAARNYQLISRSTGSGGGKSSHSLSFLLPGRPDLAVPFTIETIGNLSVDSNVVLRLPLAIGDALGVQRRPEQVSGGVLSVPVKAVGVSAIGTGMLEKGLLEKCGAQVEVPESVFTASGVWEFAVRQVYLGKEVGRVCWRFGQEAVVS
ncbi:subtilisin-like protein [Aulographum hederae CBS 113979]|uniref:Subtilisin-like protein n=1 Tax=Aulographum hederae CBS 113979 TaxID=1176131 RepID=A0A6G1HCJ2_9PEZI|nr:subtilisin-like protein [Aulographum hederae CBS 113979]